MIKKRTWVIEDHLCRSCGGRILRCATGNGMSGGGNPYFKCADCGKITSGMLPDCLCWCGFSHRNQPSTAYVCLPFSILETRPELKNAFASCGCDPKNGEVGIILKRDFYPSEDI